MSDRFQGDPKLYLTPDGSTLRFVSGQPVMDGGFENMAFISLFTKPGWWGNDLVDSDDKVIGSDFEENATGAITLSKLNDIRQAAIDSLENQAFGDLVAEVVNPQANNIDVKITISPPGRDIQELIISRNGQNWINQALDPAYLK